MATAVAATINAQHSRFSDAPWYKKTNEMVMVGGAGGIGRL